MEKTFKNIKDPEISNEVKLFLQEYGWDLFKVPSQSIVLIWIRKNLGYHLCIIPTINGYYTYKWVKIDFKTEEPPYSEVSEFDYKTPEEAINKAVLKLLNNYI